MRLGNNYEIVMGLKMFLVARLLIEFVSVILRADIAFSGIIFDRRPCALVTEKFSMKMLKLSKIGWRWMFIFFFFGKVFRIIAS